MRAALEARRTKIQARLEHLSTMRNVETDLRNTHIDNTSAMDATPSTSTPDNRLSMDDAIFINSPIEGSSSSSMPIIMSTKARILASPIRVVSSKRSLNDSVAYFS